MRPLKFEELRACDLCRQPVAGKTREGHAIDFRIVTIERQFLDPAALRERLGLTVMMGSEELAGVFASHGTATIPLSKRELFVCNPCFYGRGNAWEQISDEERGRLTMAAAPPEKL